MSVSALLAMLHGGLPRAQDSGAQSPTVGDERTITDFSGREDRRGVSALDWYTVLDGVMGGRSTGELTVEDGVLRFRGVLNTDGGGFASIRSEERDLGLDGHVGLYVRVRGDGRQYSMRLEQLGRSRGVRASYRGTFDTVDTGLGERGGGPTAVAGAVAPGGWQDVYLPFEEFVPTWRGRVLDRPEIDPARIGVVGLTIADGVDGPFAIDVDSIRAYRPFELDTLRDERRVLVVFAPDAAHPRLLRLLVDLADDERGCEERELSVVVVLDDGPSRVGPRPLSSAETRAIRARFDVATGSFVAILVGKDGAEKHRSQTLVRAQDWFERIDLASQR